MWAGVGLLGATSKHNTPTSVIGPFPPPSQDLPPKAMLAYCVLKECICRVSIAAFCWPTAVMAPGGGVATQQGPL